MDISPHWLYTLDMGIKRTPIPGFPDYAVTRSGAVWTRCPYWGTTKWRLMKPKTLTNGYRVVDLSCDGKKYQRYVHRLVLETFVGACPARMVCRHFPDRNPANNRLKNLSWGTRKQNSEDRNYHGTHTRGERSSRAKLTNKQAEKIRKLHTTGMTMAQLARDYKVCETVIERIVKFRSYV